MMYLEKKLRKCGCKSSLKKRLFDSAPSMSKIKHGNGLLDPFSLPAIGFVIWKARCSF